MSATYQPDDSAIPQFPWNITFLSQRDVALQIPINYIVGPGVALTPACFPDHVYADDAIVKCVSNLLAVGFRRFLVDIYWDAPRRVWSLCPVQLPASSSSSSSRSSSGSRATATASIASATGGSATTGLRGDLSTTAVSQPFSGGSSLPQPDATSSSPGSGSSVGDLRPRQVVSTSNPLSAAAVSTSATVTGLESSDTTTLGATAGILPVSTSASLVTSAAASVLMTTSPEVSSATSVATSTTSTIPTTTISQLPGSSGAGTVLYKTGQYTCSPEADLTLLMSMLEDFFDSTNTNVAAVLKYFIFNFHAAASGLDPEGPASQPSADELPSASELLGAQVKVQMDGYLFTPSMLLKDRSDLNTTWLKASNITQPDPAYYTVQLKKDDTAFSPNGWPSESYLVFTDFDRILIGSGSVDPQMLNYDFESDSTNMFTPLGGNGAADISIGRPVTDLAIANTGALTSGCIFKPLHPFLDSSTNNSWATATTTLNPLAGLTNLTACGISTILNQTLNSISAAQNPIAYQEYSYTTIWSWAPSQPAVSASNPLFRCAALNTARGGRWVVRDCSERHRGACRLAHQPYAWSLTASTASYTGVEPLCGAAATFAVPRTPLENDYLFAAALNASGRGAAATRIPAAEPPASTAAGAGADPLVWLNFNCLDVQSCWVVGTDGACPYDQSPDSLERTIVVPAVAAVVVIVLAVLTVVAKCAGNRREGRRRRRGKGRGGSWDYEGVPS